MSKGKTEFTFQVNAAPEMIDGVIRNYLMANSFAPVPKPNANYYYFYDPLVKGKRSIEYYINGNLVTILAYIGKYEKPHALEGFAGSVPKQAFKNDLEPLFRELRNLENANTGNPQMNYNQNINNQNINNQNIQNDQMTGNWNMQNNGYNQTDPSMNTFIEEVNHKKETWTVIGFVMSLLGVILSFFGLTYGVLLLILELYFGVQGLKTKKRGLAISTIVLACLSFVILILNVLIYIFVL